MNTARLIVSLCVAFLAACAHAPEATIKKSDNFWFIFLESGKKTPDNKALVGQMQRGHIDNFKRLFGEQKLFAAGPLQDPSGLKRGIVVVKAASKDVLTAYFQPDEYVRDGYMTLNAVPCIVHKALATEGIEPTGVEEVRIIQILRSSNTAAGVDPKIGHAFLKSLVSNGTVGAWYSLESGPVAEVLFSRTTDTKMLQDAFAQHPAAKTAGTEVLVWGQWLSKGVLK